MSILMLDLAIAPKLVFITHAPDGTLGDTSATLKLIKQIKEQNTEIDIKIIVHVDPKNQDRVRNVIPPGIDFTLMEKIDADIANNLAHILPDCNAIIAYPAAHFLNIREMEVLSKLNKPLISASEYNFQLEYFKNAGHFFNQFPQMVHLETGLSPPGSDSEKIGIFLTNEVNSPANKNLSQIDSPSDICVRDFLLGSNDELGSLESKYFDSHQLFFGYFNNLDLQDKYSIINATQFIEGCIIKSIHNQENMKDKKIIDIFVPVQSKEVTGNSHTDIERIMQYFQTCETIDFKDIKIEYYTKKEDKLELHSQTGEGSLIVRIINGFPVSANTMGKMFKASDPFCLITGDQSASEAISNEKIFLYQTMKWKINFYLALIEMVKAYLGKESYLFRYLSLQRDSSNDTKQRSKNWYEIINLINAHQDELIKEMAQFKNMLLEKNNLNVNLPKKIVELATQYQAYLAQILKQDKLDFRCLTEIIKMFPQNKEDIANQIIKYFSSQKKMSFDIKMMAFLMKHSSLSTSNQVLQDFIHSIPKPPTDLYLPGKIPSLEEVSIVMSKIENSHDKFQFFASLFCTYSEDYDDPSQRYFLLFILNNAHAQWIDLKNDILYEMIRQVPDEKLIEFLFENPGKSDVHYINNFLKMIFFTSSNMHIGIHILEAVRDDPNSENIIKYLMTLLNEDPNKNMTLDLFLRHFEGVLSPPQMEIVKSQYSKLAVDPKEELIQYIENDEVDNAFKLIDNLDENSLNYQDKYGFTALMRSFICEHYDLTEKLIQKGVDLDLKETNGRTALMIALDCRFFAVAKRLIDAGANLNVVQKQNYTNETEYQDILEYIQTKQKAFASDVRPAPITPQQKKDINSSDAYISNNVENETSTGIKPQKK